MMKKGNSKQELGRKSEKLVARWLKRKRFRILSRNFRYHTGEVDIVASRSEIVYFVEVRSRKAQGVGNQISSGEIADSISKRKLSKIMKTGMIFMKKEGLEEMDVNVLIMTVNWYNPKRPKIRAIPVY